MNISLSILVPVFLAIHLHTQHYYLLNLLFESFCHYTHIWCVPSLKKSKHFITLIRFLLMTTTLKRWIDRFSTTYAVPMQKPSAVSKLRRASCIPQSCQQPRRNWRTHLSGRIPSNLLARRD
jgi:hypothetical protein